MITYHHIGGRNGTFPIPLKNVSFSQEVHLVLYEADPDCYEQILQAEKGTFGKVTVHPYCIGEKTEAGYLNINFHPTTSSLYEFNEAFQDYTCLINPIYGEFRLGDACQFIKSIPLNLFSLEDALHQADIQAIDFLSLDIQGAEYDVLKGSRELIEKNCLGIQLEVEFATIYKNQKLFFDIHQLMESMGFELIEFSSFDRYAPSSMPIGFRGSEQPLYGEAVYIKKIDQVIESKNRERLYKWAFFALINKKMGLCAKALKALSTVEKKQELRKFQYVSLLEKIWALYQEEELCTLPHLAELFSSEILSAFYQGIPNDSLKFSDANKSIREYLRNKYMVYLPKVERLSKDVETPFELLLKQHGLFDVAQTVKENRVRESVCFLRLIRSLKM